MLEMSGIAVSLTLIGLAFIQNMSFTLVSRARNRDSKLYHTVCSIFSNSVWFITMGILVKMDMDFILFIPYLLGTVCGSLFGAEVAIKVEKFINAKT